MSELKPEELVEIRERQALYDLGNVSTAGAIGDRRKLLGHEATLRAKLADAAVWRRQAELELRHYGAELASANERIVMIQKERDETMREREIARAERDKLIAEWAGRLAKDLVVAGEIEYATIPTLDAAELAGMAEREAERRGWQRACDALVTTCNGHYGAISEWLRGEAP